MKIASNNFSLNKYACFKIHLRVSDKEMRIPTSNSTQLLHQIALFSPNIALLYPEAEWGNEHLFQRMQWEWSCFIKLAFIVPLTIEF